MKAIAIAVPKMYKEQDESLLGYISKLSEDLPVELRAYFVYLQNDVLSAANSQTDVYCYDEFKPLISYLKGTVSVEFFDIMALNCFTCLADLIPEALSPISFLAEKMEGLVLDAFLRYLNNYFGQKSGMQSGRKNMKRYVEFLTSQYPNSKQNVLRVFFTMSRFTTVYNAVASNVFEALFECLSDIHKIDTYQKHYKACANLAFGALGCMLLTFKKYDMVMYNKYSWMVKKQLYLFDDLDVPCLKELIELTGWKKTATEDELY